MPTQILSTDYGKAHMLVERQKIIHCDVAACTYQWKVRTVNLCRRGWVIDDVSKQWAYSAHEKRTEEFNACINRATLDHGVLFGDPTNHVAKMTGREVVHGVDDDVKEIYNHKANPHIGKGDERSKCQAQTN